MSAGPRRRAAKRFALRGLRLLRHHYLTLFSAVVLVTLTVVALRSDAFQSSGRPPELPAILRNPPPGEDIGRQFTQSILWSPPSAELGLRSVVYYLYETEEQRRFTEMSLRELSRARFKLDEGGPEDTNVFVRVATPEEEASATQELAQAEELAKLQGFSFEVVDLRSEQYN